MELTKEEGYKTISKEERLELIELIHDYNPQLISPTTFRGRNTTQMADDFPYLGLGNHNITICSWSMTPRRWLRLLTREEFLKKVIGRDFYDFTPLTQKKTET